MLLNKHWVNEEIQGEIKNTGQKKKKTKSDNDYKALSIQA